MAWLADSTNGGIDLGLLAQYGVLGIFSVLLILFARVSYKRETDRADRLEMEVQRLNALIADKVIPAVFSATQALEASQELLKSMQQERTADATNRRRTT